ncbi:MAG: T9SS type A sorting domain-containing protein, partial [Chitinophagaceae bacterium]|nr:T9SS type A sorting domain-containing protein [Chitinophagaceae bacterium]
DVNIYAIASGNDQLTLDSRPIANNTIIPVGFTSTIQSNFEIALNSNTLNNGLDVIVKDKFLNVEHTLTASNPYSFAVTADVASQGENRFELVFRTSNALPSNFVTVSAVQQGNAIAVNFITVNEQNMSSYEVEESANGNSFTKSTSIKANNTTTANYNWLDATINNGNNYYRIKAIEKNGVVKYSQVVNVRTGTKGAEFTVYPNPVKGGTVNVQLMNVEQGLYSIKIVNKLGQEIASRMITHNGGSATQSINIGNVASGTYNMVISNGTTSVTKAVIVE